MGKKGVVQKDWTPEEVQFLKDNYQKKFNQELADALGRTKNAIIQKLYRLGIKGNRPKFKGGNSGSFGKGRIPWNKGVKGIHMNPKTEFKKGCEPYNTKYDGCITRRDKSRIPYLYIRISKSKWEFYHRYLWKQSFGKIPKHHVVRFKNGNTLDCRLENLELISRDEHCRKNYNPPKITNDYAALTLSHCRPEIREEIKKHKELIEIQKLKLQLNRSIKECQTA